jgi:hypothetical protein
MWKSVSLPSLLSPDKIFLFGLSGIPFITPFSGLKIKKDKNDRE